ncbi:MAG: LysM peptidoglycan-binding domain-containing protein [Luteolibacter sp.]
MRILFVLAVSGMIPLGAQAPGQRVQAGLETAVKWKWWAVPSEEKDWGFPAQQPEVPSEAVSANDATGKKTQASTHPAVSIAPGDYEVKRGDALAKIARKAGISVEQLKIFNALPNDAIRIGQVLKIPTLAEVMAIVPPPPPPVAQIVPEEPKKGKKSKAIVPVEPVVDLEAEATLLQVFLDREDFSCGPIDGNRGAAFEQILAIYRGTHSGLTTPEELRAKAVEVAEHPFTVYQLIAADFCFIEVPKAADHAPAAPPKSKGGKPVASPKAPPPPPLTYEELVAEKFSAYRTAWEFVAEKFHCDEAFLRSLNPKIKDTPAAGAEFKVPNVVPFEVEKCFAGPLQPAADPTKPVTAAILEYSRLEIRQAEQLVAVMPVSRARPGLRGKGTWTVLSAIPGPRLATRQEPSTPPKPGNPAASAPAADAVAPALTEDQFLAAGPRNPVGICWINLAKAKSTTPLPYGLHGTSIPSRMKTYEGIGGIRLTNWDIARAARLLPEGTPLVWK